MFQFFLQKIWYRENFYKYLFMPLSWAFHVCLILRKKAYQTGIFKIYKANCPVVVIGNITVGGTGKTPITIWLADYFISKGYKILILSISPAEAFIKEGVSIGELFLSRHTASKLKANADLIIDPTF